MAEIASVPPTFAGVSFEKLDKLGSVQWPCNDRAPEGTPVMHVDKFVRGKGKFVLTPFVATRERSTRKYPLILTTGRILTQYNIGAQTRRTANVAWHPEDMLEVHLHDAEVRGIKTGDQVRLSSQGRHHDLPRRGRRTDAGQRRLHNLPSPYHRGDVVTTENPDWATNCPEYKVTTVQVAPAGAPEEAARSERCSSSHELGCLTPDPDGERYRGPVGPSATAPSGHRDRQPHHDVLRSAGCGRNWTGSRPPPPTRSIR